MGARTKDFLGRAAREVTPRRLNYQQGSATLVAPEEPPMMERTARMVGQICIALACVSSFAFSQSSRPEISPAQSCGSLTGFHIADVNITITKATAVPPAPPNTIKPVPFLPF